MQILNIFNGNFFTIVKILLVKIGANFLKLNFHNLRHQKPNILVTLASPFGTTDDDGA